MADEAARDAWVLRRLPRDEAVTRADQLAGIYGAAMGYAAEPVGRWAEVLRGTAQDYAGATVLAAEGGSGAILGFLYGFDLDREHWWPREVAGTLTERGHGAWLEDAFELMELQVHPLAQGRGIGSALVRRQCAEMPHSRMLLATHPDGRARLLYRRLGFVDLAPDFVYAGTTERAALMGWQAHPAEAGSPSSSA